VAYCWSCNTPDEFVRRLVSGFLTHGYVFYVAGHVPEPKDPRQVEKKLASRYDLETSKGSRVRRKQRGIANLALLRFRRFFILLATHGRHRFFEEEGDRIRDFRRQPLLFSGYSVSLRRDGCDASRWRGSVRMAPVEYRILKRAFIARALDASSDLSVRLGNLPFEPYAPVRRQLLNVLRAVNRTRKRACLEVLPPAVLRLSRLSRTEPSAAPRRPSEGRGGTTAR
jgi:hypothetical protein